MLRNLRILSLLPLLCAPALAQQQQLQQIFKAGKIVFQNPGPYSQSALEATAGLHVGDQFTYDTLANADQKLMDTGLFTDVQGTVDGPFSAITAIITLKPLPPDQLLPARFDNYIWSGRAELLAGLQRTVPLFNGSLPEAGTLADSVNAALESLLAAKGIASPAVVHEVITPTTADPIRHITYTVTRPQLRTRTITLTGITPSLHPALDKAISSLTNRTFSDARVTSVLLDPCRDTGYLGAQLINIQYAITPTPDHLDLDITADLQPGDIYRVASLRFDGTPFLSAEAFAKSATLHPGDLATRKALLETLAPIDAAYHAQGYMNEAAIAAPTLDASAHTVTYTITVVPGDQFILRSIQPTGLTPQLMAAFQSTWKLHPGALYNSDYVLDFIKQNIAQPTFRDYGITFKATADPDSHQVDLIVNFVPGSNAH